MKNTATKTAKTETENQKYTEREKLTLADISRQIEMALTSDKTPQGVKDCIETIIIEASTEAGLPLADFSLVRAALPNIIENLNKDYERGVYHSLHAILQFDTSAFKEFYDQRLNEESETKPKTQDEIIAEFDRERQPYLELLKSLDDRETAQRFKDEKTERAKTLISEILMVTCGVFVEPENKDWAHEHLLEILGIFMIRHKNFSRSDFAEDLQFHIFNETKSYDNCYHKWRKSSLAKRELDYYGVELEKATEAEPVLDLPEMATKDLETDDLTELANQLSAVMKNPLLPTKLYEVMADELIENPYDANSSEWILDSLKSQMENKKEN